ncbi:MAG: alkaline phosphatase family protein [Phycisphaerales bacterium]|nr:alkaline phosphatase family protein [Phycisphaerales bacterium]
MPHPTAVLNVVGLSSSLLGPDTPHLSALAQRHAMRTLAPVLPAVTCPVQSSMLTGLPVRDHGIVANGWYDRDRCEVQFWKQSNRLVHGEKVWETAKRRDPSVTCANMFWWFNMYSTADVSVTPRPMYPADGRKIPDVYTEPAGLRDELQARHGQFPLFKFWGPMASIDSSRWIARASMDVHERVNPTLMLIYLPHLDYALQRSGPGSPEAAAAVREIDALVGELLAFFEGRGTRVVVLSEYGIEPVTEAIDVNRTLRDAGLLRVREELGRELLDAGASDAFAVCDHQVAHVYIADPEALPSVRATLATRAGVDRALDRDEQHALGIDHPRAGELVLVAERGHWFTYDYWRDDDRAPDFARTVDIHRKPGYDPRELFVDPTLIAPTLRIAAKVARRKLGFRTLLDVIPLDTSLVRGSHGRIDQPKEERPLLIAERIDADSAALPVTSVRDVILTHLFDG